MRVLFLSDLETLGGAGLSASRLAAGLVARGIEVTRLYNNPDKAPHAERVTWTSQYVGPSRPLQILLNGTRRVAPRLVRGAGQFVSGRLLRTALAKLSFDLVHIHSIQNSDWTHKVLGALDPQMKTVWTFHDCWSFSAESQRYTGLNGEEVRLKPDGAQRGPALAARKRYFQSRKHLRLIANSEFTAREARDALGRPVEVILPGVPLDRFRPVEKGAARDALQLGRARSTILFIADNRADPLKGFELLRRALEGMDAEIDLLLVGDGPSEVGRIGRARAQPFGRVLAPELLSILYSAADLLVVPSLAEALGMVSMESIACGTPVLGSSAGGIPEIVQPGKTGFIFKSGDVAALQSQLEQALADRSGLVSLGRDLRRYAEEHWSIDRHTQRHIELYRALLG